MRVFMDVGAHYGETLEVALDPGWDFGRIYSFEPAHACQAVLRGFRDPRLRLVDRGLSNGLRKAILHGAGLLGASVYSDKPQDRAVEFETIALERTTDWLLANTADDDEVYLKLNCEGSECDVLQDLLDGGLVGRVRSVYVDFDVRKIPSQAHRQAGIERRLRANGVHFNTPDDLALAGSDGVRKWLDEVCPRRPASMPDRIRYRLRLYRPPYVWARTGARALLPRSVFAWVARRAGRQARRRL